MRLPRYDVRQGVGLIQRSPLLLSYILRALLLTILNQIHFGAPLPPAFGALIRVKLGHAHPTLMRRTVLEGHRFTPPELLDAGAIDAVVDGKPTRLMFHIEIWYFNSMERVRWS